MDRDGDLADLLDNVRTCVDLAPGERQTSFVLMGDQDRFRTYTEHAGLIRRLLLHREFEAVELRECAAGCDHPPFGKSVAPSDYTGGAVTGVKGFIPVGALTVSKSSRTTHNKSAVVSETVLQNDPRKGAGD